MRSFDQQIPFELGDGVEHLHGHCAGRAGKVSSSEREARNANTHLCQRLDGRANVNRISPETVELGHDEDVSSLQLVHQP